MATNLALTKFGEPVEFISKPDLFFQDKKAFLDFDKFEIAPSQAEVIFHYAVKGLTITLIFEKLEGNWAIKTKTISEG